MACSSKAATTMRALVYSKKENALGMVVKELAKPKLGKNQILVNVVAAGINPVDYKLPGLPFSGTQGRPVGLDLSGVVAEVGENVDASLGFEKGTEVYGNSKNGCIAEYVVCEPDTIAKKPANITHVEAASLPTVALTGLQSIRAASIKKGDKLLVLGASGGCGSIGVQIGKILGAHVTGVCSTANVELATSLGCDKVIDYKKEDFSEVLPPHELDGIYDTVTSGDAKDPNYEPQGRKVLKKDSMYVAINGSTKDWIRKFAWFKRKNYTLWLTQHSREDLTTLAGWVEEGRLKPLMDAEYDLTQEGCEAAFEKLQSRRSKGKAVIKVAQQGAVAVAADAHAADAVEPAPSKEADAAKEGATEEDVAKEEEDAAAEADASKEEQKQE